MKKGFTLVELLVVIAVIGILSAIITPNLLNARNSARIAANQRFDSSIYHSIGDQLVGEWTFDVPGSSLIDTSGMGNNGSTTTDPVYYQTGGYNGKGDFYFDGTDDFIYLGTSNVLAMETNDFTMTAWVYPTALSVNWQGIVGGEIGALAFGFAGNILRATKRSIVDVPVSNYNITNNLNKWIFVAITFNSHLTSNNFTYYVDGSLNKTVTFNYDFDSGKKSYYIGKHADSGSWLNGYIDDVRMYTTVLSSSEIQKLYAEGAEEHKMTVK